LGSRILLPKSLLPQPTNNKIWREHRPTVGVGTNPAIKAGQRPRFRMNGPKSPSSKMPKLKGCPPKRNALMKRESIKEV